MEIRISSPQEALALADVINPGGPRFQPDGTISSGLDLHETNCTIVAIATAAFLQDKTETSAFSAPSALLFKGNGFLVSEIVCTPTLSAHNRDVPIISIQSNTPIPTKLQEILKMKNKIMSEFPNQQFLVHGKSKSSHHWFNITSQGTVLDAQSGLIGDELLLGQNLHDGLRQFESIEFYPVDPMISGHDILAGAENTHQFNGMLDLARCLRSTLDPEQTINLIETIDNIVDPYVEKNISPETTNGSLIYNDITDQWFNTYCSKLIDMIDIQDRDGYNEVLNTITSAIIPQKDLEHNGHPQTWLSEGTFRQPGLVEPTPSIIEIFENRCPLLKQALDRMRGLDQAPTSIPPTSR